jgi:PAS domain S-box-containing protein
LDWLIVTVVPEADFMTQINATTHITILLCIAALIGSTGIGILTARWITQPILRLNTAAKDIAKGQWNKTVESERADEVGELTNSFNKMAAQLQESFAELNSLNESLSQSESKLNQILEAIPVGVSVHDITGKLIYANQTSRQLLGIETLPEAETKQLAEVYQVYQAGTEQLYPPENMPVVRSLRGERARVDDMEIRLPDRRVPLEVYSTPLLDGTGKVVAAIAAFFDITERKHAEHLLAEYNHTLEAQVSERTVELIAANEKLRLEVAERNLLEGKLHSSTEQVRTILESLTDIVLIIDEKKNLQVIPTKAIGWNACDTKWLNSIVEPFFQEETAEIWLAKVQQVVETQQSINFDYSLRINNQEVWFTACISPLSNNSVVWVARDISDVYEELHLRKVAEAKLLEAHKLARMGNWEYDAVTQTTTWSEELYRIHQLEPSQGPIQPDESIRFIHPEDRDRYLNLVREKAVAGRPFEADLRIILNDGSIRYIETRGEPIFDDQGQLVRLFGTILDITDRIQVELELRKQKELRESIYNESTDALFLVDPKTLLITDCNRRAVELFEVTGKEDLIGIEGRTLQRRPFTSEEIDQITTEMSQKGFWYREIEYVTRKGKVFWGNIAAKPVQIADQVVNLVRVTDISSRKQFEQALIESEERFREIAGTISQCFFVRASTGEFLYVSPAYEKIWGRTCESLYQNPESWMEILHPDDRQLVEGSLRAQFKGNPVKRQYRIIRPDGQERWIVTSISVVRDDAGQPLRFIGIAEDISDAYRQATQRKRFEQALIESEARFQAFMNYSPLLAWISDGDGKVLYCNRSVELWTERAASELIGETIWALHPPNIAQQHLENIRYVLNTRQVLETNESAFTPDGTLHEFLTYKFPLIDANGQCLVGGIAADITDRKRAEEALQESQARLEKLTNNVPGSIYAVVLHSDGSISFEYTSSAVRDIHELEPEQVLENATLLFDHMHPDDRASYSLAVEISAQTLELFRHQWRIITPSGKLKWLQAQSKPERRSNGDIVWYGVVFDITDKKQAEESLRRYERIVSATADAMSLVDRNYIYQVVNQTYLTWHNQPYDEIVGHSVSEILGAQAFETVIKERLNLSLAGQTVQYQDWFEFASLGRRFLSVTYSPYLEADNTISGVVVSLRDITELQQAEEALRESEAQLNMIVTNTCDGILILDEQGKIGFANPAAVELFNRPPEELIGYLWGMPLQETAEIELMGSNGQIRIAEMKAVRTTWQGESAYVVVLRDISDRKRAELELQEREYRLRTLADNLPNGLIYQLVQEPNGKVYFSYITAGIERLVGIKPEVVMQDASVLHNIIIEEDRLLNEQLTEESRRNLSLFEMQMRKRTPTGEIQWSYVRSAPRRLDDGRTVWDGIEIDITNLKQAEAELAKAKEAAEAANRAKSAFLANMSHELRTPLNGILGYAQILQADKNCTPKQKEGVDIIYQCGTHLLTLISDILDLSKIEAEKLELYPEDFHFPSFLTGVTEIFRLKAAQKSINFTYLALNPLPRVIHADEKRLRQVLMNLLSNAVKFTDTGSVTFKVEVISHKPSVMGNREQDQLPITDYRLPITDYPLPIIKLRFQVEDTGIGITSEQLEKIFLPFEQVGDTSRRSEGTGLGLAISQKIVEMMGSQIFVESTPGVGSLFGFDLDLPEVSTPTQLMSMKTTDNIIGYSGSKRKILVVDDHWENRAVIINMLEPLGFELLEAATGQEGLEKAVECKPDLILADLVMPVMDGYQMTQRLRQIPEFQNTTIIAISASVFEAYQQKSQESGCQDFLPKPVQAEELLNKIKSYLNLSWIYDKEGTRDWGVGHQDEKRTSPQPPPSPSEMVIPPPEELLALYEAANSGDVEGVEQGAMGLKQLNPDYTPFATRILELAQDFNYEEIAKLVALYLSHRSE